MANQGDPNTIEELNESELSGENAEVHLFQWLSTTEKKLEAISLSDLKPIQPVLEKTYAKIISSSTADGVNYPPPGRAIRKLVGRSLVTLYRKGETRTMFDTLQVLMRLVGDPPKGSQQPPVTELVKTAAFSCIGDLMAVYGGQVMSFMAEMCAVSIKAYRASSSSPLLRYHALIALSKALFSAKRAVQESTTKDIVRQMKTALVDKSLSIQRAATQVLIALYTPPDEAPLSGISEVDTIIGQCVRSIEGADQLTRHAHAMLVGHLLALTQVERVVPSADNTAKAPKKDSTDGHPSLVDDEDVGGSKGAAATEVMKPMLSPSEMFLHLSMHFNKPGSSKRTKIGIIDFYAALLTKLGQTFCETNYSLLVNHLLTELVSHQKLVHPPPMISTQVVRYEILLVRTLVGILLRDLVGVRMLTEQGQIAAIQELATQYLKRWPAMMPGQVAPNKFVLVCALREVAGLLQQLGNAPPPVQSALSDPLVTLLAHPSHSVRITAGWALRCFCFSTPLRLPRTLITLTEKLQKDLSTLLTPNISAEIPLRALGHAYGLAALVSVIPQRPLYVSYDVPAKVLDLASQLLKKSSEHDLKIADVEVEVAWALISSLMALGPNFVRPHLPQLLVLWRNALPKPTTKDTNVRSPTEWGFLLHVREAALGAVWCFLEGDRNKATLVTLDVARRISSLLSNALSFANSFVGTGVDDLTDLPPGHSNAAGVQRPPHSGPTLREREALLRRRVHQCFGSLGFSSIPSQTQIVLLQSVISLFASPEGYAGSSVQAAIASNTGSFNGLWNSSGTNIGDGYAYGVTGDEVVDLGGVGADGESGFAGFGGSEPGESAEGSKAGEEKDYLNRDVVEVKVDILNRKPIIGGCEYDPLSLCQSTPSSGSGSTATPGAAGTSTSYQLLEPPPPTTSVVDTAIQLFSKLLPLQDQQSTQKMFLLLLENVRSPKLEKNLGRKAAVWVNACVALVWTLRVAMGVGFVRQAKETFGSPAVTGLLSPFLMEALVDGDLVLRSSASESIGRLASLSGTNFLTSQIKDLVDQVVNNRNPSGRAGCALAFGAIYSHVGGLAAGPLLKTTVNVLMSLIKDPHPTVHFWSLNALARVINAASLAYAPFVSSTLGIMMNVYLVESHEREGGNLSNSNLSGDFPAYPIACQIVDAVITVLGPDIQESARTRGIVQSLVREFLREDDEGMIVEAIKCVQHFLMFAPEHADITDLVNRFRGYLSSTRRPLKLASINALYQLVQKDAVEMSKIGGDGLVEDLFGLLDDSDQHQGSVQGVRGVIESWLKQTGSLNPSAWIDLCQRIMNRTTASQQVVDAAAAGASATDTAGGIPALRDDEGESLNVGLGGDASSGARRTRRLTSRWRTQLFALQCLHEICGIVSQSGRKEHLNAIYARKQGLGASGGANFLLYTRVGDLIKMAFTASTAYVTEIRLAGLVVLRDVIEIFAASPDPAYDDALLLEQHQAPITAALTPAFSSDSTPEILASAVHACAVFVGCGVVKDINRMGRILKLLTIALEQSKDSGMVSLGETGELSPNASAMLRIATLSAWAQLQVSSIQQSYLENVVKPYRPTLSSLWIAALRDYASIRVDSEFLHDTSSVALDSSYSSLGKEVLLPYYSRSWFVILQAVATAMQIRDPYILAAMDGKELGISDKSQNQTTPSTERRKEPTVFFYVIFGLVYEALATSSADAGSISSSPSTRQAAVIAALQALKHLVKPDYAGSAILEPTIFEEFISLCYRMGMTEAPSVQVQLVEMLAIFSQTQSGASGGDVLTLTSPSAHCLRICSNILKQATSSRISVPQSQLSDRITIISSSIQAFAAIASSIASSQREDVRGVAILLYTDLLKDETSEIDFVSPTLPALKTLLDLPVRSMSEDQERYSRLVHALLSSCLLNIDSMRGRAGSISSKKMKNNMLTSVLVLTVTPTWVKIGRAVVEHACFLISQKLLDAHEVSLTAAHCSKTLILASSSGSQLLRHCARLLVPGLVEFVAKIAPLVHDGSISDSQAASVGEVWKAFSAFFMSTSEDSRPQVLAVLLPTISLLLTPDVSPHPISATVVAQSVVQLLSFASTSPAAFKDVASKLEPSARELLELSIRRAVGGSNAAQASAMKPQISLRSF